MNLSSHTKITEINAVKTFSELILPLSAMCKQLCSRTMNMEARSEKEHFKFIKLILIN